MDVLKLNQIKKKKKKKKNSVHI